MESMMTVRQVAELLGVHENWVYDHAASGDLPSYKIGGVRRFIREEVLGWIAALRESERKGPERQERKPKKRSRPKAPRRREDGQPRLFE
jgi:excisionase family DNA binding protein